MYRRNFAKNYSISSQTHIRAFSRETRSTRHFAKGRNLAVIFWRKRGYQQWHPFRGCLQVFYVIWVFCQRLTATTIVLFHRSDWGSILQAERCELFRSEGNISLVLCEQESVWNNRLCARLVHFPSMPYGQPITGWSTGFFQGYRKILQKDVLKGAICKIFACISQTETSSELLICLRPWPFC